jgi:cell division septation protein DedD
MLGTLLLGGAIVWALTQGGSRGGVPVVEADPRPVKVRPDDRGGLQVANQDELIFERRPGPTAAGQGLARLAPASEAPNLDRLRAIVAPPPPAAAPESAPDAAAPSAPAVAVAPPPAEAPPAPQPVVQPQPQPRQVANGRVQIQLGALPSEELARTEWERLQRRMPELLSERRPQIMRLDREGQSPMFRIRTGGFASGDTAREFCDQVKGRGGVCAVIGG